MPPWYLPLLLLLVFWLLAEAPMSRHRERMKPSEHDRSTIWVNTVLGLGGFIASFAIAPWAREQPALRLPSWLAWGGILIMAMGTLLRMWSMRILGRFHTGTLQIQSDQVIVESGPYHWLRHPSYLGGDIALLGIGLASGAWPSALLMALPFFAAHVWRIPIEERMLHGAFGEPWAAYAKRTWRMIPFLW